MSVSPRGRVLSPPKSTGSVKVALEKKAGLVRFRFFSNEGLFWTVTSVILSIEILLLKGGILRILSHLIHPLSLNIAYLIEVPLLVISVINAFTCFCVAFKSIFLNASNSTELSREQLQLLGLEKHDGSFLSRSEPTPASPMFEEDKAKNDRQFSFNWLSALQFGSFRNAWKPHIRNPTYDVIGSRVVSSVDKSSSLLNSSGFPLNLEPALRFRHPLEDDSDRALAAEVGSRTSPYSKLTTSVQTTKQLENLIENTSKVDGASVHPEMSGGSSPFYGSFSGQRTNAFSIRSQYHLITSGSPGYELGTSFTEEDHAKNVNDENGVISLVTGSRIRVSSDRVSLSPIPLNLLKTTRDIGGSADDAPNGEKGASSRIIDNRNDDEDSTSFRIEHNAARKSPRKFSLARRSESWERRRAVSVSPISSASSSPFSVAFASADSSSPNILAKQISLSSAEILNQYKLGAEQFAISERLLRSWICRTIVRPLVHNIDKLNAIFSKDYPLLHIQIGRSTVQALQSALSSKPDLFSTQLPYLIPYLKIHEKQAYVVRRARALGADMYMKEYNWQSGGGESVEEREQGDHSYSPKELPWGEHLPTDAQLVWSWFSAYFDARMAANSMAGDLQTPFSSVYFLKKPGKPSAVQCAPDSFYIHQVSMHPPQFELVVEGGRERFEMSRGPKNLWRTILLFLQHARLFNNNRIGEIAINETGVNIAYILE